MLIGLFKLKGGVFLVFFFRFFFLNGNIVLLMDILGLLGYLIGMLVEGGM